MEIATFLAFFLIIHSAFTKKHSQPEHDTHTPAVTSLSCATRCMSETACTRFMITTTGNCLLNGEKRNLYDPDKESFLLVNSHHEAARRPERRPLFVSLYFQKGLQLSTPERDQIACPCSVTIYKQVIALDKLVLGIVPRFYYNPATQKTVDIVKSKSHTDISLIESKTCRIHVFSKSKSMYYTKCVDGSQHVLQQTFRIKLKTRMVSLDSKGHLLFILTDNRQIYCLKQGEEGFTYMEHKSAIGMGVDSHNSQLYVNLKEFVSIVKYKGCQKKDTTQLVLQTPAERLAVNPTGDKVFYCEGTRVVVYLPQDLRKFHYNLAGLCLRVVTVEEDVWALCVGSRNITVLSFKEERFAVIRHLSFFTL